MAASPYSRSAATLRFHYDESHPNAYGYYYASSSPGTSAAWVANVHGGAWSQPGYDEDNERLPTAEMTNSTATLDAIAAAGTAAVFVLEYPLGSHTGGWDGRGTACSKFPEVWQSLGRAIQFIKDNAGPGGLWEGQIDPDDGMILANSSGAMVALMTQWVPDSWGMFPRAPGPHVALGHVLPRADQRVKALVMSGPTINFMQCDPGRAIAGSYAPLPVVTVAPYFYRPRVTVTGTLSGTIPVGARVQLQGTATINGTIYSLSGGVAQILVEGGTTAQWDALVSTNVLEEITRNSSYAWATTGDTFTLTASPTIEDYHGWFELPRNWKEAMCPALLLDYMNQSDLSVARQTAIYAHVSTNPSVAFNLSHIASETAARTMVARKYGVDDGYDIAYLEAKLAELTGFTTEFYWGQPTGTIAGVGARQIISAATAANPIVCTTTEEHGIVTGDSVIISEGLVMTAINGTHTATRISATQFSIPVLGVGSYTANSAYVRFNNANGNYGSLSNATTIVNFLQSAAVGWGV